MIDFHEPLLFGKLTRKINAFIRAQSEELRRLTEAWVLVKVRRRDL